MSLADYAIGLLALAAFVTPLAVAARELRRQLLPAWSGAPAVLAQGVATLSLIIVVSELLGLVGLFAVEWLIAGAFAAAGVARLTLGRLTPSPHAPRAPGSHPALTWASIAGALLVFGQWGAGTANALDRGMTAADTIWYHLPFAARIAQDGTLTGVHFIEIESVTAFYPLNAELLHAIGIEVFSRDVMSPFLNIAFVALALLAGWCLGRPWGVAPLSLLATCVAISVPVIWGINAGQAGNDIVLIALFLAAAALVANAQGSGAGMAFAAAAAGLAAGVKLSGLAPVAFLTVAAFALAPPGRRLRSGGMWFALLFATGGFWYARNLFWTGTPLPWIDLTLGPLSLDAPPHGLSDPYDFAVSHYLTDTGIWNDYFRPWYDWAFGGLWFVVLPLALAGAVGAIAARGDAVRRSLGAVAALGIVAYVITPHGAAGREGDPWAIGLNSRPLGAALALSLALLPTWLAARGQRRQVVIAVALSALLVGTLLADTGVWSYRRDEALLVAAGAGLLTLGAWWLARQARPALTVGATAAVVLALAGAGYAAVRAYVHDRYRTELSEARFAWARDLRDTRIGVLGLSTHYALYGDDLSNRVVHIGRRGDTGGFLRIGSCREWRRAVNDGRFRYVVVVPVTSFHLPAEVPKKPPPELAWTAGDSAAVEVFRDATSAVFRIEGRLAEDRCA
jgi:hypothetical protein